MDKALQEVNALRDAIEYADEIVLSALRLMVIERIKEDPINYSSLVVCITNRQRQINGNKWFPKISS